MNWRQNPTRVGWIILLASFFMCCLLTVTVPLGIRSFVLHATRTRIASASATTGTAQLWTPNATDPTAVTSRRPVVEGSRLVTDATAKALLTLATDDAGERVLAIVQLYPNSTVTLQRARIPRFDLSPDPHRIGLGLDQGRMSVTAQRTDAREVAVSVTTPQAIITFGTGTFDIILSGNQSQVRVRSGVARIEAEGQLVTASAGQRVGVTAGRAPDLPVPDTVNLVLNGAFEGGLTPLWEEFAEVKAGHRPGSVTLIADGRRRALRFSRREEDGVPNRVGVTQVVNRDVEGYDALALRLDLRLIHQSLPGGGQNATEYPLMVDVFFTDIYGKDIHWYKGFYYLDLLAGSPYLTPQREDQAPADAAYFPPTAERVPIGIWYTYESPNLFDLLKKTRPARIISISVYGIGHDYESYVSDVGLTVR